MKTASDPRHLKRRQIVKTLFAQTFNSSQEFPDETKQIIRKIKKIDGIISQSAPAWPIEKINKIDLSILRYSVYELITKDTPYKVIIDEAIELAKEFGSEASPSFVNGVLGDIYININSKDTKKIKRSKNK